MAIRCNESALSHAPDYTLIVHRNYPDDRGYAEALSAHYARGSRSLFGGITGPTRDIVRPENLRPTS